VHRLGAPHDTGGAGLPDRGGRRLATREHRVEPDVLELAAQPLDRRGQGVDPLGQGPVGVAGGRADLVAGAQADPLDLLEHALLDVDPEHLHPGTQGDRDGQQDDGHDGQDDGHAQRAQALAEQQDQDGHRGEPDAGPEQAGQQTPPSLIRARRHR
jgi:hypothetical protein